MLLKIILNGKLLTGMRINGTYITSNGKAYVGPWKGGIPIGVHEVTLGDGTKTEGCTNGNINDDGSSTFSFEVCETTSSEKPDDSDSDNDYNDSLPDEVDFDNDKNDDGVPDKFDFGDDLDQIRFVEILRQI